MLWWLYDLATNVHQTTQHNQLYVCMYVLTLHYLYIIDTPLTDDGVVEATVAGQMLEKSGIMFDEVHTSLLRRSIRTVNLVLMEMGQEYLPLHKSWRLNERSYGDLVGKNKKEAVLEHGVEQVKRWRRSYDEPPPPMADDHPYHPANDARYQHVRLCYGMLVTLCLWSV